jgi:hypothetical protein
MPAQNGAAAWPAGFGVLEHALRLLNHHGRTIALMVLALTFLPNVPAQTIMGWDANHFHLPDFSLHLAECY